MDRNKLAEHLYLDYAETEPIDNPQIWEKYRSLRAGIRHLDLADQEMILALAADLANTQEQAAFLAGLRVGWQQSKKK